MALGGLAQSGRRGAAGLGGVRLGRYLSAAVRGVPREQETVDVCIVGGGPSGLAAAIRLRQLARAQGREGLRVVVLEKGAEIGAHVLSGAVLEPRAVDELLPDWRTAADTAGEPVTLARSDRTRFLTRTRAVPVPTPPPMVNRGRNHVLSLSRFAKYLAEQAEALGAEVYAGFGASEVLYDRAGGSVTGVATNDVGVGRDGEPTEGFVRGMEFRARVTLFAEGCHGSLTKELVQKYSLRKRADAQTYALGLKEVWQVRPDVFESGATAHTLGFPLDYRTYGGGWMYHFGDGLVSVGLVVGLDYQNPYLSPYGEFQKMKQHPFYARVLEGGKCISYGARALNEGGFQSVPKVVFPGGALIGDTAGFLNVVKIKGTHTAMKSGMLAGEAAFEALGSESESAIQLFAYEERLKESWVWKELRQIRNVRPSFGTALGLYGGLAYSGLDTYVLRGLAPWTFHHRTTDAAATRPASEFREIVYPKPDGKLTFDILTSVSRTGTNHAENQPVHLRVDDWIAHGEAAYPVYKGIEARFCPAAVYEYLDDASQPSGKRFNINSQNCIHCKTCDIKVPTQDINWQVPQGGDGPQYVLT